MKQFFAVVLLGLSAMQYAQAEDQRSVRIEILLLENSGWSEQEALAAIEGGAAIMRQCGIKLEVIGQTKYVNGFDAEGVVKLGYDSGADWYQVEAAMHHSLPPAPGSHIVRMFFVGKVRGMPGVLGVSRRVERHAGEIYENATYISNQLGYSHADQTVAHELGHVLLNEGHYSEVPPNIMHYDHTRQNDEFDLSQCKKMQSNPLNN